MSVPGQPRFDGNARNFLQQAIRTKVIELMPSGESVRIQGRMNNLSLNFRKAIPVLREIAIENGFTGISKKLRTFRLPKRLRRNKNPIMSWNRR